MVCDADASVTERVPARIADDAPLIGERYRLGPPLGQCANGAVHWAVRADGMGRLAVKLLHTSDKKQASRMGREAQALASLAHPHIVRVVDIDVDAEYGAFLVICTPVFWMILA